MDKPTAHQKALPTRVFQKLYDLCLTSQDFAIAWLIIGAMFFAMRSCEYSMTKNAANQRTRTIRVENIRFYKNRRLVHHHDPHLNLADAVCITFELQKNDKKFDSATTHKTSHPLLNPV